MRKILVVDDEFEIVRLLHKFLSTKGYDVFTATSGAEAVEIVKKERPQIVLLDIIMPRMNGLEALQEIKKVDPEIGVIMVTAVMDEEMAKQAVDMGAYDYITKPIDLKYLETTVLIKMFRMPEV